MRSKQISIGQVGKFFYEYPTTRSYNNILAKLPQSTKEIVALNEFNHFCENLQKSFESFDC